ncbi:ArgS-related anticodon-binding protein NrtL [Streptomyces sp. NPDC020681]|uniref:ArgS-related anticodon-binding protein NrtL n=1 Tax=Streptomyces sp. NPDC020681 TaxID=3365083 RepID=UPI0037AEAC1B
MTPAELSRTVLHAVRRAVADGALHVSVPASVGVERPRPGGTGDYASNVALKLAGPAGLPPREVAEILRPRVAGAPGIAGIEITGAGFLNFTLEDGAQTGLVRRVLAQGGSYGHGDDLADTAVSLRGSDDPRSRIWIEAVSALIRSQGGDPENGPEETLHVLAAGTDPLDLLGSDATRWACLRAAAHDHPTTGPHLLTRHESNPLFKVQYAYARSRALTRNAADLGFTGAPEVHVDGAERLTTAIADHPSLLASAARLRAPDRLARHLEVTADALLGFQHTVLPLGDEKPSAAHRSRLALAEAAGAVLVGGLSLLGVSAPEYL